MAKKKLSHQEKVINALRSLPVPLVDKKHGIEIYFLDDRARSNQTRFEHIDVKHHGLTDKDIYRIPKKLNDSELRIDKRLKDTYNLFIKRNSYSNECIKIGLDLNFAISNKAKVKTIMIKKNSK